MIPKILGLKRSLAFGCLFAAGLIGPGQAQDSEVLGHAGATKRSAPHLHAERKQENGRVKALEKPRNNVTSAEPAKVNPGAGEVTKFQGWAVTCFPAPAGGGVRSCIGKMNILKSNEDRRPIIFLSIIKSGGSTNLAIQTPTSVELKGGVNLQLGQSAVRHIDYASCEPALCTAIVPLDDALANELGSFPTASASWSGLGIGEVRVEFGLQEARNVLAFLATR